MQFGIQIFQPTLYTTLPDYMEQKTVAQKLDALTNLQKLDKELDKLHKLRGDLPDEVQDLEDEIAGYQTKIERYDNDIASYEQGITELKQGIKDAEKLIEKYNEQQMNVRNNREYEAISKEIEMAQLNIQLFEKRTREAYEKIDLKKADIEKVRSTMEERVKDLEVKKSELDELIKESSGEEQKLMDKREKISNSFEDKRLLRAYNKIRDNVINGLAVVEVQRGACGGCFAMVPPQRRSEIKERKKIIVCEHCGRIFNGVEDVIEEPQPKKTRGRAKKAAK